MRTKKKNSFTGCTLYQLIKSRNQVRAYRKETRQAFSEYLLARHNVKRLQDERSFFYGMVEYLEHHVINSTSVEQLNQQREKYMEFKRKQSEEYRKKAQEQKQVAYSFEGKNYVQQF